LVVKGEWQKKLSHRKGVRTAEEMNPVLFPKKKKKRNFTNPSHLYRGGKNERGGKQQKKHYGEEGRGKRVLSPFHRRRSIHRKRGKEKGPLILRRCSGEGGGGVLLF